jgi:threonine dehydrogenase-like Zn-dependent dehydrogenase
MDDVEIDTKQIVKKELEVLGSRNALDEFRSVIDMLEQRERPFDEMVSRVVAIEDVAEAFADWSASPGDFTRILVRVGGA